MWNGEDEMILVEGGRLADMLHRFASFQLIPNGWDPGKLLVATMEGPTREK